VAPETAALSAQQQHDDVLDIDDVVGKRFIETGAGPGVTVREENAVAALEVMSASRRTQVAGLSAADHVALETACRGNLLEHPSEAFAHYSVPESNGGVRREAHGLARRRGGLPGRSGRGGAIRGRKAKGGHRLTRAPGAASSTTRPWKRNSSPRVGAARGRRVFRRVRSDWFVLDCELMPWSAKAQDLLRNQYAAVGASASHALRRCAASASASHPAEGDLSRLVDGLRQRAELVDKYIASYRRYCWPTEGLSGLKLAPFHLLASERPRAHGQGSSVAHAHVWRNWRPSIRTVHGHAASRRESRERRRSRRCRSRGGRNSRRAAARAW
jgi:hypothetical protein